MVFKVAPGLKVGRMKQKVREEEREWQQTKAETTAGIQAGTGGGQEEENSTAAAEQPMAAVSRPLGVAELSLPLSLAFLYVALQSCRCPLPMHQLVSLARINRLPYLNFIQPSTLPPRLHNLLTTSPSVRSFYRPSILPSTPTLLQLAHHVCAVLDLTTPATVGRQRRETSVRATFGLHDDWFHVNGCVRAYMRQLHVPEVLYGLCVAMTRVWMVAMEDKWRKMRSRRRRRRAAERKYEGQDDDEDGEEEEEVELVGDAGMASGGHDEWSVMVCVVTVLKLVYGLDRVADTEKQQAEDEKNAEGTPEDEKEKNEEQADGDDEEAEKRDRQESEEDEIRWRSEGSAGQRKVNVADRWQTEEEEMEEYRLLQLLYQEEEDERERQQKADAALQDDCNSLLQMLADDYQPPPSTSLDADLVRLFNPSTHFPSSMYEARHMRPDQQEDMLRLWDEAILPPSLGIDDYGEYIDKMKALHPPLDTDSAAAAADKPSLASLWRHLSTTLTHSHHATYRQYSQSTLYAAQPLHADYQLVIHCGALLCGLSANSLHRRVWRWGQQLWRWMGRRRYHSVGWKKYDKLLKARGERLRRKRKRELQTGLAESEAEGEIEGDAGAERDVEEPDEDDEPQVEEAQLNEEEKQEDEEKQEERGDESDSDALEDEGD